MHSDIKRYNQAQAPKDGAICRLLAQEIDRNMPEAESKIWHRHPVWFLDGNPIVGYSKLKDCVRLLFWSGQSFKEKGLHKEGTFKAAEARYTAVDQVDTERLARSGEFQEIGPTELSDVGDGGQRGQNPDLQPAGPQSKRESGEENATRQRSHRGGQSSLEN